MVLVIYFDPLVIEVDPPPIPCFGVEFKWLDSLEFIHCLPFLFNQPYWSLFAIELNSKVIVNIGKPK